MNKNFGNYQVSLRIADDYYSAFISIWYSDITSDEKPSFSEVMAFIKENNIVYGLNEKAIKTACDLGTDVVEILIAEGLHHQNGMNAQLTYHVSFEIKPKPKINEDGSVNFKELSFVQMVRKGELLVSRRAPTEGTDGMTVTNKPVKAKVGKEMLISYGENTVLSEDGLELVSEVDGIPKKNNGRISVVEQIEVKTVGPETGNIYFSGDVRVKENILDGYTVTCDGDLIVDGVVEGSILKVKGNLLVGKGIAGHGESDIVVDGTLTSKFIENANVYVKGEIQTGEIINSSVLCDSRVIVKGKKGLIIGGEITSKYMIEANRIGSKLGVITSINLGIDAGAIRELKILKETVQELKIVEKRIEALIPVIKTKLKEDSDDVALKLKLKQYEDSLQSTRMDMEKKMKRLEVIHEALKNVKNGRIKVNTIYPDALVKIGTSKYFIDTALKDCIITRENDKVITIGF